MVYFTKKNWIGSNWMCWSPGVLDGKTLARGKLVQTDCQKLLVGHRFVWPTEPIIRLYCWRPQCRHIAPTAVEREIVVRSELRFDSTVLKVLYTFCRGGVQGDCEISRHNDMKTIFVHSTQRLLSESSFKFDPSVLSVLSIPWTTDDQYQFDFAKNWQSINIIIKR